MSNRIRVNILLDYYGGLLTARQQKLCRYYYREDLSMSEIAELENISKAGVSDTIRKCEAELERYESILKCVQAKEMRQRIYRQMEEDPSCRKYIHKLNETELIGGEYE